MVNTKLQLDRLIPGVTCEACHGPGGTHAGVMLFTLGKCMYIFNPKILDAESLSQEFCGARHRGVDTVAMMPDLGAINNVRFSLIACSTAAGTIRRTRVLLVLLVTTPCGSETRGRYLRFQVHDVLCTARCGTSDGTGRYGNGWQTAGSFLHGKIVSCGKRAVCELSHAKGGVIGRALQNLPTTAFESRGKGKRILTEVSIGDHLIPDPSTMVMYRSIGRSLNVSVRPLG